MGKRFNINVLMSFLSKKGALLLGLFAGVMIALLSSIIVNAEETADSSTETLLVTGEAYSESWNKTGIDLKFGVIGCDISNVVCWKKEYKTFSNGVMQYQYFFTTVDKNKYSWYRYAYSNFDKGDYVRTDYGSSVNGAIYLDSGASVHCLEFATQELAEQYISGEIDASCALNFDEISESNSTYGFDSNVPYYDNASFANNVDDSAQYTAKMSSDMQSGIVSGGEYYITLNTYALYFSNDDMTVIEKMAMKGLENDAKYPFIEKYLTYDSEGRLTVNYAIETSGSDGFSGGGGRHSLMLTEDSGSKLVAVPLEIVDITDKYPFSYTLARNMMAQTYDGYHHVGYASEITIYKKDGLSYTYGKTAYSYTWIYDFMRENFGNETYFTDDKGSIDKGNSYSFDSDGSSVDVVGELSSDSFDDYIKNGFGLAGKDGYLEMLRHYFLGVPDYIWEIIAFALVWNLVLIMVMALRGM